MHYAYDIDAWRVKKAVEAARQAARASGDLAALRQQARAVIHAVEPARVPSGPGRGYGARRAVAEARAATERAVAADAAAADVATRWRATAGRSG